MSEFKPITHVETRVFIVENIMNDLATKIQQAQKTYNDLALQALQRLEARRQSVAALVEKETAVVDSEKKKRKRG